MTIYRSAQVYSSHGFWWVRLYDGDAILKRTKRFDVWSNALKWAVKKVRA